MNIVRAVAADAGEIMTVQRAAYVSEAQLYDNGVGRELMLAIENHVPPSVERFAPHTGDRSAANLRLYRKIGYEQTRAERAADTLSLIHMEKPAPNR